MPPDFLINGFQETIHISFLDGTPAISPFWSVTAILQIISFLINCTIPEKNPKLQAFLPCHLCDIFGVVQANERQQPPAGHALQNAQILSIIKPDQVIS